MLTDIAKQVLGLIDPHEVVTSTQGLGRIPSVYRPKSGVGGERADRWVRERATEMGLTTHRQVAPGRRIFGRDRGRGHGWTRRR